MSDEARRKIVSKWSPDLDRVHEVYNDIKFKWPWPTGLRPKTRLTQEQAETAQLYINLIVKRDFPFQLRNRMGHQLWIEFCEYWAINPDFDKAMRYL